VNQAINVKAVPSVGERGELSKLVTIALFVVGVLAVAAMFAVRIGVTEHWPWPNANADASCGCFGPVTRCLVKGYGGSWLKLSLDTVLTGGLVVGVGSLPFVAAMRGRWLLMLSLLSVMFLGSVLVENIGLVPASHECSVIE
jgi:hypothetical protein